VLWLALDNDEQLTRVRRQQLLHCVGANMSGRVPCLWAIETLLPHAHPMILLDRIVEHGPTGVLATVVIRPDHPFAAPEGIPAHVGIEVMAQACGAFSGAKARAEGCLPRIGLLLGTRDFRATFDWFRFGEEVSITAELLYRDAEIGAFACRVWRGMELAPEAQLTVCELLDKTFLSPEQEGENV